MTNLKLADLKERLFWLSLQAEDLADELERHKMHSEELAANRAYIAAMLEVVRAYQDAAAAG
jgi:hypothetical protein